jgi:hypothetical protein
MNNHLPSETRNSEFLFDRSLFTDCKCPRVHSLIESICQPLIPGYLNFSGHLLETVIHELSLGHVNPSQANIVYERLIEIHNHNLLECDISTSISESNSDDLKFRIDATFLKRSEKFQVDFQKLSEVNDQQIAIQPLCVEVLSTKVIG